MVLNYLVMCFQMKYSSFEKDKVSLMLHVKIHDKIVKSRVNETRYYFETAQNISIKI